MTTGREGSTRSASASGTFELERFTWGGPDRLQVAGRFVGVGEAATAEPVLTVRGPDGTQRLEAVPGSVSGSPGLGGRWRAEFAWREAPAAFEVAELELGEDLVVELPDPSGRRRSFGRQVLEVRRSAASEVNGDGDAAPATGTERVRMQADLLVAQEEARELRAELDRALDDLAAAQATLQAERERHAEDAERFRRELAEVSAAAEEAVAADRSAAQRANEELAEREELLEGARAEAHALRTRADELEAVAADAETLRARVEELEAVAREADALHAQIDELEGIADEAEALRARVDELELVARDAESLRARVGELHGIARETDALRERVGELEAVAGEVESLRSRVDELEGAAGEADALRARVAELERDAEDARSLRTEHERVRAAVDEARAGLEGLLSRLPGSDAGREHGSGDA